MNAFRTAELPGPDTDVVIRVTELLEGYLPLAVRRMWPGTDGLTVSEVVGALYLAEARAGRVPDRVELAQRHPELGTEIEMFLG